jgi:hypothetical protein
MKVQVQTPMVNALEIDDNFAVLGGFVDPGKPGHASDGCTHVVAIMW